MKQHHPRRAAMLWTGGKDSSLALHEACDDGYDVVCLVTFAPAQPDFLAHPLRFMMMQAHALGLPHYVFPVAEPYAESYEAGLRRLRDEMAIDTVITGDIAEVGGSPNWIRERSRPVGMDVHTPLWGRDRAALLAQLLGGRFKVLFSCVKTKWLADDWVGRELDDAAITELRSVRERNGLDLCGEEGEYHTLVADCPRFRHAIRINEYTRQTKGSLAHMKIQRLEFVSK